MHNDEGKTREQLLAELVELHQRIVELEAAEIERKQAEEALRRSEEAYRLLFEQSADGVVIIAKGRIARANHAFCAFHGLPVEKIVGMNPLDLVHPEDRDIGAQRIAAIRSGETVPESHVYRVLREDGSVFWGEVRSKRIEWEGEPALQSIVRDISERKRAEEALRQHTAQLDALRQVGLELTAQLDLDALLHSIVSRAIELLGGDAGGLYLYRPEQDVLEWTVAIGPDVAPMGTVLHRGEGLSGKILETAELLIVDDYQHWEGRATAWEGYPSQAVIGVPVSWGEEFLGVLDLRAAPPCTFSPADADLLSLFANQAAIAIRNARLYDEARSRAERLAVVNRIAKAAGATLHLDDLMETVYREIAPVFQADAFFIALYDEEADELNFPFWLDEEFPTPPARKPLGTGLTSRIIIEKRPLIIRDKQELDCLLPLAGLPVPEIKLAASWLGVPMLVGERVVGVISVQAHRPHAWDAEDELLLFTIADQVAVALESTRLFEEARIRAEELAVLNELGQALTARLDVEEVLKEAHRQAARLVDTTNFYIGLYDPEKDEITFPLNISESELDDSITALSADQGITGYVIRNRTSVLIEENISGWLEEMDIELVGQEAASWLGVPLMIGDQVLGVIVVQSYTTPRRYDEHDRDLLTAIAAQASIAIQNARLFEMERRRTSQLAAVARVAGQITSILNLNDLLCETVELITQAFGHYYVAIMLLDADANELVFKVSAGGYAGWTPAGFRQKVKEGMIGWAAHLGATILANDIDQEPRYIPAYLTETRSELDVPLKYHDRVIGVLDLQSKELNAFSPHDVIAMETLAGHVAAAIENARLYEQAQHEIVERKQAEEALRTAYEERRQTQAQLIQSARMAAIGQLAAGVAHEINNPLTSILGFAELLLRNAAPDDPNWERLNIIAREARRVRDIVRALLNFSRQTIPHREMAHVNQIVLDTLVLVRQRLEKSGVTLEEHYAPDLPPLWLDVGQMRQVVLNLVTNAIHAMPQGGTLTVTSERAGNEAAVRIADTGGGISVEDLPHIFDPFFTTRPVGHGTGLGLSISLGIVQEHGGRIEVESREREGSTFTVWLPVAIADGAAGGVS